ncbi:MAG: HDIG domain-containing metalloprotein [Bacteroidota bacterium]
MKQNNQETLFQKITARDTVKDELSKARFSLKFKILIILATVAICSIFFLYQIDPSFDVQNRYNLVPGYYWRGSTLVADYPFPIYKSTAAYQNEVRQARENTNFVFILDKNAEAISIKKINSILDSLKLLNTDKFDEKSLEQVVSLKVIQSFKNLPKNERNAKISRMKELINQFLVEVYNNGIVNINVDKIKLDAINVRVSANRETIYPKSSLLDKGSFLTKLRQFAELRFENEENLVISTVYRHVQPNLLYSEELTERQRQINEKSIPKTIGIVRKNEVIISKGERLTDDNIQKIKSYNVSKVMRDEEVTTTYNIIGSIGHAAIIYAILLLYLFFIRKKIFNDNLYLLILNILLVVVSAAAWLTVNIYSESPIEYLIFLPTLSMLIAILFDSRTAFYATVTMALMISGIRGNDYSTGTAMLFAGILAAYTVRDIQSRTQIFRSIFYIFIGLGLVIIFLGFERSDELNNIFSKLLFAGINSVVAPILTFGGIYIVESLTDLVTDLKIKEFDDLNHPLLLKMNEVAPGTYQHTVGVAFFAERCAQAIGANQLLTKVGAYFHDIGKISKSEYFTENQIEIGNKLDMLPPKRSAIAIREHVSDGVELAKQYKIPSKIIDFIPMHHGTTIIKHFHAKALEEASEKGSEVNQDDFRYPGPKPNSRETAILMICDAAEAISRVKDYDKDDIMKKINQSIDEKILDGQFDNSNLTFEDVKIIKDTINKIIVAKSHQRVVYKEIPQK